MNHVACAWKVLHAHILAMNSHDPIEIAATPHFPHFGLSGTGLKKWPTPDTYFEDFKSRADNS